jgi:acyl-coenzyme A thioesterase PaaI-like protein
VFADWTPDPAVHQGWPHAIHGGLIATLLDEAASYVAFVRNDRAATARLNIRFFGPAIVDDLLRVDARLTRATRRLLEVHSWVSNRATGSTIAEADASLMLMTDEQRHEFGVKSS